MGRRVMEMHVAVTRQPQIALWLGGREIVEDPVYLPLRVVRDELVHEVEELDASSPFVVTAGHLAGGDVEGGEQRGRAVPLAVMRLADHRAAAGQLEISLGSLKRLNGRLLIHRQDEGIVRWGH